MIKEVEGFSWETEFPAAATAAMLRDGADTLVFTQRYYEVRNPQGELIMALGVAVWSFARPPELWVVLGKPYFVNVRKSLNITRADMALPVSHYPGLVCDVRKDNAMELHFVKHHGWTPTGKRSLRPNGDSFIQFGVK